MTQAANDFRALCAELADALDHSHQCLMDDRSLTHPLADRARAALAKPADCDYPSCVDDSPDERCSRWLTGECPGPDARAALAAEESGPTYREVLAMRDALDTQGFGTVDLLAFARAVLARYGSAPRPIPVAGDVSKEDGNG